MESKKKSILMRAACIAVLLLACSLVLGGSVQAKVVKAAGGQCCPKCTNAGCQHPCPPGCCPGCAGCDVKAPASAPVKPA